MENAFECVICGEESVLGPVERKVLEWKVSRKGKKEMKRYAKSRASLSAEEIRDIKKELKVIKAYKGHTEIFVCYGCSGNGIRPLDILVNNPHLAGRTDYLYRALEYATPAGLSVTLTPLEA